ncbi:MAG: copper amine oxidase N-terminal domain-containing protein [Clostridia bacterium]|nr:copper amine oxidase N-terminal domain-containing protein [Clostridia bacterium]
MNKKIFWLFVILMMMFTTIYAANPITVQLNGEYIDFTDENGNVVNPEMINNRTMVPMRKIFEVVGAQIEWDGEERKITATTEEKVINLQIDNAKASVQDRVTNEITEITLDSAPLILNNRTMVPVRFIAESLEKQVGWDNENRSVIIIDYSFIEDGIRKNAPTLVEFLEMKKEIMESYKVKTKISGNVSYKDDENRKNNEKVTIDGEAILQKNKEGIYDFDFEIDLSGNGEIQKALEDAQYDEYKFEFITNGNETYTKASNADTKKWVKSLVNVNIATDTEYSLNDYVEELKIPEENLNINSYSEIQTVLESLYKMYGEDNFKVTGTKNKKYELSLDLAEMLNASDEKQNDLLEFLSVGSMNLNIAITYKEDRLSKVETEIDFYMQNSETEESISANIETESTFSSINSNIKLSMPKASQIEKGD